MHIRELDGKIESLDRKIYNKSEDIWRINNKIEEINEDIKSLFLIVSKLSKDNKCEISSEEMLDLKFMEAIERLRMKLGLQL